LPSTNITESSTNLNSFLTGLRNMISVNQKNKIGKRKTNPNKTTPKIVNPDNSKAIEDQNSQKMTRKRNGIMVLVDISRLVVTSMSSF